MIGPWPSTPRESFGQSDHGVCHFSRDVLGVCGHAPSDAWHGSDVKSSRLAVLAALVVVLATYSRAQSDGPEQVRPSTGPVEKLHKASTEVVDTLGKRLDAGHDWLYRRLQRLFEKIDLRFGSSDQAPIVVPLSPVRIGFDAQFLHRHDGVDFSGSRDLESALALPNIERRMKLFVTSGAVQEAPAIPAEQHNPLSFGAQFVAQSHLKLELGVRGSSSPSAFAAVRWAPTLSLGELSLYPFVKPYVQSGLGIGTSGGIALEAWRDRWMVRSTSYANWVRNTSATDWSQTLVFGYARAVIQERRYDRFATGHDLACGVVAHLSVSGDRSSHASLYEVGVLMKRPLHAGWLFGYIEPVTQWNRTYGWHPDIGIRIGFDVVFWGLASVPGEVRSYCTSAGRS